MNNADQFGRLKRRLAAMSVAVAMTLGMGAIPLAVGAPSAKPDRIAQLESAIARNRVKVDEAQLNYAQTAEDFAEATDALNAATAKASESARKVGMNTPAIRDSRKIISALAASAKAKRIPVGQAAKPETFTSDAFTSTVFPASAGLLDSSPEAPDFTA